MYLKLWLVVVLGYVQPSNVHGVDELDGGGGLRTISRLLSCSSYLVTYCVKSERNF
jgi:hypothetical protein